MSVIYNDRHWFDSWVDETRVETFPRFANLAFYCNVRAVVWARVIIQAPTDPHHRTWHTFHVESSPVYKAGWGARYPASMLPAPPFARYAACFGYFPRCFWERELLVATLNILRDQHEHDHFTRLCRSVGL